MSRAQAWAGGAGRAGMTGCSGLEGVLAGGGHQSSTAPPSRADAPAPPGAAAPRLDGRRYAVKKIKMNTQLPGSYARILREVATLSRLQHPSIVRYFQVGVWGGGSGGGGGGA